MHFLLILVLVILIGYFILLFMISFSSKAVPDNDHLELYKGALYVAGVESESNWDYFAGIPDICFRLFAINWENRGI